jgi:hypothetical protein
MHPRCAPQSGLARLIARIKRRTSSGTVGQTSVTKYMARRRRPPSQGWRTFLRNHADGIVAMDLFVVPTISFQLLYGLVSRVVHAVGRILPRPILGGLHHEYVRI